MTAIQRSSRVPVRFRIAGCLLGLVLGAAAPASGPELDLTPYRGSVVVVDFWASWCKPCRQSIPWLNELRARHGARGLVVIGVNVDAQRLDADRFLHDVPIQFEQRFDPQGVIARQFDVQAMPSTYVFDRQGRLVRTHLGFRDNRRGEREAEIQALLSPSPQRTGDEPQ
jgi:thiol-disulfide isomerase/thioredoxin